MYVGIVDAYSYVHVDIADCFPVLLLFQISGPIISLHSSEFVKSIKERIFTKIVGKIASNVILP